MEASSRCNNQDFCKAFNSVLQIKLLQVFANFGFAINALELFSSFLSGRTADVEHNKSQSESFVVKSGVPWGSILAGMLFNVYPDSI